jgi:hypothetical protein
MDENQNNHRQAYLWWAKGIFLFLAASFALNLWPPVKEYLFGAFFKGSSSRLIKKSQSPLVFASTREVTLPPNYVKEVKKNPLIESQYSFKGPVRKPMTDPVIEKDGYAYRCNDCHQDIVPSSVRKSFFSAHENIILKHGANNYCTACHGMGDREYLVGVNDNNNVSFSRSELLCVKCHENIYRYWEKGFHGRMNNNGDDKDSNNIGKAGKLTCAACHDPHQPQFKPLRPAPPPHQRLQDGNR